jgi:23S rRNA (adenine2030-N6)-methyltransferase
MNYRHAFHAGNHADVVKHVVLVALLEALCGKDKPFSALDLHAGIGRYTLAAEASKTGEYVDGIVRIEHESAAPAAVARYLDLVRGFNPSGRLEIYPGSPRLIRALMRPEDRLALVELHPEDHARLRAEFAGDGQVAIHHRDAWEALRGLLPPQPRRGLLLLDPPYEQPDELARLARGIATAHRRWPEGVIAGWYPIKDRPPVDVMLTALPPLPRAWVAELTVFDTLFPARLNGSGLILANLPWGVEEPLREALAWLQPRLARQGGAWRLEPLPD